MPHLPGTPASAPKKKPSSKAQSTAMPEVGSTARLPKRISPSRAKDYMQCPKLFYYKTILGLPTPGTVHTARGTLAHTAFELVFDHPKGERSPEVSVAYVRPAWRVMLDPLADRSTVVPGTEEERIRVAYESFRDLVEPGSKQEKRMQASAKDYVDILVKEAATQGTTYAEAEEALLSSAEDMVRGWYGLEKPDKFEPAGREVHLESKTAGTIVHGFIDRLDKIFTRDGEEKVIISDYKGLAVDTPLPTPSGWTTMGEVEVGDFLLGSDGTPTVVTVKSDVHNRPCYEVHFDDNTSVVCDNVHLWQVDVISATSTGTRVVDADELHALVSAADGPLVQVLNPAPFQGNEIELPLHPYTLGSRIGSGSQPATYGPALAPYLRASYRQRLLVLQGIVDVAGTWDDDRYRVVAHVDSSVADLLTELTSSMGWWTCRHDALDGVDVVFYPNDNPFLLSSEATHFGPGPGRPARTVTRVDVVDSVPTQCVAVSAPDSLYLAGRQMVPTHNTGKVPGDGKNYSPFMQKRIEDESFFAMRVYALLYYEIHKVIPAQLRLLYVRKGDQTGVKTLPITPAVINQTRKQVTNIWKNIKESARKETWETQTGPLCNWCHFQDVCPAFNDGVDKMLPEAMALRGEPVVDEAEVLIPPAAAVAEDEPFSETVQADLDILEGNDLPSDK